MRTVENLIEELRKFPKDAMTYAYEGEGCGIVIKTKNGKHGFIYDGEWKEKDAATEEIS